MNESNQYRLSLHISHPSLVVSDIVQYFKFPARYLRSVGEKRRTKTGRDLGGIYAKTDISFDVSGGVVSNDKITLFSCIQDSFRELPLDEIKNFVLTGGECFYLAGIYAEDNFVVYFPSGFLSVLSSSPIGLKFDFYGGENSS